MFLFLCSEHSIVNNISKIGTYPYLGKGNDRKKYEGDIWLFKNKILGAIMCNGKKKKIFHNKKIDTNGMHTGVKIVME